MRRGARALVAALAGFPSLVGLVVGAGCSNLSAESTSYRGPKNKCDNECGEGNACIDGFCRASKAAYPLILEVTPPAAAHYAPSITFTIPVDDRSDRQRELALPAIARVAIRLDARNILGPQGAAIPVVVRLMRQGGTPGASGGVFEARSGVAPRGAPPGQGSVELDVPPGTYDVYVSPSDAKTLSQIPPVPLGVRTFEKGQRQELVVAYGGELRAYDIQIKNSDPSTPKLDDPTDGRDVFVFDTTTQRLVSTIANTCADPGHARVLLAPGVVGHTYALRVAEPKVPCAASKPTPLRPTYDFDLQALDVEAKRVATVTIPSAALLRATPPRRVDGAVTAFGSSRAVAATVVLRSKSLKSQAPKAGRAWIELRAETTSAGRFSLEAPAGLYSAEVVPDLSSDFSSLYSILTTNVFIAGEPVSFQVVPKTKVIGSIASIDGTPFPVGTIEAVAPPLLPAVDTTTPGGTEVSSIRSQKAALGAATFSLSLDPGVYDFAGRIPEASGFPWIFFPSIDVPQATVAAPRLDVRVVRATPPVIFTGRVVDPSSDPVGRATVRGLAIVGEGTPQAHALTVAETRSREDGTYRLLLPSAASAISRE